MSTTFNDNAIRIPSFQATFSFKEIPNLGSCCGSALTARAQGMQERKENRSPRKAGRKERRSTRNARVQRERECKESGSTKRAGAQVVQAARESKQDQSRKGPTYQKSVSQ